MPRPLVLSNGSMFATFDGNLEMRDFYFPYVGMEDHTKYGERHRIGVWAEGKGYSWLSDPEWEITIRYQPETLVGSTLLRNDTLGIKMTVEDQIHPVYNILLRRFFIKNLWNTEREIRLFVHHNFNIYGDKQKETAFYEPYTNSVIHYRQTRYFLIGGMSSTPAQCLEKIQSGRYASTLREMAQLDRCGVSSFTVGKNNYQGMEGTWKDAEDGELSRNTIEQGSVDSTIAIHSIVKPDEETEVSMWLCAGRTMDEVFALQQMVMEESPGRLHSHCTNYWKSWVNKANRDFGNLDTELINLYKRSLLTIRAHADNTGGIVAAADSDIMAFNRDTYTYVWPRDGALVCMALDEAGYLEVTRRFFEFCADVQSPDGYLLHKYNPDKSLGSSWHPWYSDGEPQLPIQEDETALVVHALWQHFQKIQDFEFLQRMYENFVRGAATFLAEFREEATGLPLASYDPWEEHRGVFTYTTACTIAGLRAAAQIANILGHHRHSEQYQTAADEMRQAMLFHLFDEETGRFVKFIRRKDGKTVHRDTTPDASLCIIWKLGILTPYDLRITSTMEQLNQHLKVHTNIGGWARYTNDYYHAVVAPTREIPGNPWIITTLWNAQWHIELAKNKEDLQTAYDALLWTQKYAGTTGILAEQLNPLTGAPLSVAPLTWSHATYVETVLMLLKKEKELAE
ncbi:glycoside hydrolase family 15 protein [Candidatus Peribacteria bacterium]|nr:glycoside hydrolase family 15 protein [Candidatus Peribacteria bacterium]